MLSPLLVGPILREKCLCAQCISNTTRVCLKALEKHFFLLYVVAGIVRHEYKQGWKFLTLWDGYGLSEATWERMSAFMQPDGSINPMFRTYLVENNEGQLLTRAGTMSQRKKRN